MFNVSRVVLAPPRWRAVASVTNKTGTPLLIDRPHRPGATLFGLLSFKSSNDRELRQTIANRRYRSLNTAKPAVFVLDS